MRINLYPSINWFTDNVPIIICTTKGRNHYTDLKHCLSILRKLKFLVIVPNESQLKTVIISYLEAASKQKSDKGILFVIDKLL